MENFGQLYYVLNHMHDESKFFQAVGINVKHYGSTSHRGRDEKLGLAGQTNLTRVL